MCARVGVSPGRRLFASKAPQMVRFLLTLSWNFVYLEVRLFAEILVLAIPALPDGGSAGGVGFPAGVAQLVEQLICNQQVAGSSPIASSTHDRARMWRASSTGR